MNPLPTLKQFSSKNKIDIHRLYFAYRDRVKEVGDKVKRGTALIADRSADSEDDDIDSLATNTKTDEDKLKKSGPAGRDTSDKKTKKLQPDATDDHSHEELKCVPRQKDKNLEEELKDKHGSDTKVKSIVILKMDVPPKGKVEPQNTLVQSPINAATLDSAERRIAELNRVYKEFVNAWKKPQSDDRRPNRFSSSPVRLNALNELMNVVENLRQPHAMDDFVRAIDEQMNRGRVGLTSPDNAAQTNRKKTESTSNLFKRMSLVDTTNEQKVVPKTGGLYEEYKNKLHEILTAQDKDISISCQCDAKKPLGQDTCGDGQSQCHCEASRFALAGDLSKLSNAVVQCRCDDMRNAKLVDHRVVDQKGNNILDVLHTCQNVNRERERASNGRPKPYYISNSKQRQMVWNDIPLIRSGQRKNVQEQGKVKTGGQKDFNANGGHKPLNKNKKQLQYLLKVLQAKHRSSDGKRSSKRGLSDANQFGTVRFPQVLVNPIVSDHSQVAGNRIIDSMAKQLNVLPMDVAQHISNSPSYSLPYNSASQTIGYQGPNAPTATHKTAPETSTNVAPMLEKILNRLQTMQENRGGELPCCFAEPSDGAPCELTGSWESVLLGVRINIVDEHKVIKVAPKPTCAQPKLRSWRQCFKLTPKELQERFKMSGAMRVLNVTIEETVPPRLHEMMENLTDWSFTGQAISTLGGPVSFTCRNMNSKVMATFVGVCRNCGCIDSIFGSWTFCLPSRDCQDITMSIFERRDVLRRYSLPEVRKERIKDQLYSRSKFGKLEKISND